jgi:hypothetical protein
LIAQDLGPARRGGQQGKPHLPVPAWYVWLRGAA